jgi:hypothetical protein
VPARGASAGRKEAGGVRRSRGRLGQRAGEFSTGARQRAATSSPAERRASALAGSASVAEGEILRRRPQLRLPGDASRAAMQTRDFA